VGLVAATLLGATLVGCASQAAPAAAPAPTVPSAPLTTSDLTGAGTWLTVAMGHVDDPNNTFWQLFVLPRGAAKWSLVTPPGVADNGGLALAPASPVTGGSLLVGFLPSNQLKFSPMAVSNGAGTSWTPGVLPTGLAAVPDALAASGLETVALSGDGDLLAASGDLSTWRTVGSEPELATSPAAEPCGLVQLTAVAVTASGTLLAGAACRRPGTVGLFADEGGAWRSVGPQPPNGESPATVLRLSASARGIVALLATADSAGSSLEAVWTTAVGAGWSVSPPLAVERTAMLRAIGPVGENSVYVLIGRPDGTTTLDTVAEGAGAWVQLANPPNDTADVAFSSGRIDAVAVNSTRFSDAVLDAGTGSWVPSQSIDVPIQFGSSS